MKDSLKIEGSKTGHCALVEGPAWGDAEFYGQWLLAAVNASELLQKAKKSHAEFGEAIETL